MCLRDAIITPNVSPRLTLHYVVWFWVHPGQGCETMERTGRCQCKTAACLQLNSLSSSAINYHCLDGWLAPYSTVRYILEAAVELCHLVTSTASRTPVIHLCGSFSHLFLSCPSSLFCTSLKLHHHQSLSLSLSLHLSLFLPLSRSCITFSLICSSWGF